MNDINAQSCKRAIKITKRFPETYEHYNLKNETLDEMLNAPLWETLSTLRQQIGVMKDYSNHMASYKQNKLYKLTNKDISFITELNISQVKHHWARAKEEEEYKEYARL